MTRTMQLTVGPDGRVEVPGARPGQTVTVEIGDAPAAPERLTLATARMDEERAAIVARILRETRAVRLLAGYDGEPLSLTHGDILHGEDGLPDDHRQFRSRRDCHA